MLAQMPTKLFRVCFKVTWIVASCAVTNKYCCIALCELNCLTLICILYALNFIFHAFGIALMSELQVIYDILEPSFSFNTVHFKNTPVSSRISMILTLYDKLFGNLSMLIVLATLMNL